MSEKASEQMADNTSIIADICSELSYYSIAYQHIISYHIMPGGLVGPVLGPREAFRIFCWVSTGCVMLISPTKKEMGQQQQQQQQQQWEYHRIPTGWTPHIYIYTCTSWFINHHNQTFITPINYSYIYHKATDKATERYLGGPIL